MEKAVIRQAGVDDLRGISMVIRLFHGDKTPHYPPEQSPHAQHVLLDHIGQGLVYVAVCENRIVGVLQLSVRNFDWNPQIKHLSIIQFCVAPKYRRSGAGMELLSAARAHADYHQVDLHLHVTSGLDVELMHRFMMFCGAEHLGGNYLMRPRPLEDIKNSDTEEVAE